MATKKLASHRVDYSKDDIRQLKALIKAKTPLTEIDKALGRTAAGVRLKAYRIGILLTQSARRPAGRVVDRIVTRGQRLRGPDDQRA